MASEIVALGKLSTGEQLYLFRRRAGESLESAAKRWGVCREVYLNWERDCPGRLRPNLSKLPQLVPNAGESCALARKRWNRKLGLGAKDKIDQSVLSQILGVSRLWICRMERGREDCSRLVDYWSNNLC